MTKLQTITVAALTVLAQAQEKCYALAFSSGEQSAAYQAGVIQGLVEALGPEKTAYSAISGVSGGGVNAAIFGSFPIGQEAEAAERMVTFWQNTTKSKLYKDWIGGFFEGLTLKSGLYNDKLLHEFLAAELQDIGPMQKFVNVGITDVLKGTFVDNTENLDTNLLDVTSASFAYAGFFPPSESMGGIWFDGSVIWDIDIFSAVNKCLETHEPQDVVLDVVLTHRKILKQVDGSDFNSLQMLLRYLEISHYYGVMDGLLRAQYAYPDITFRHIVSPSSDLPCSHLPLNLSFDQISTIVQLGHKDGKQATSQTQQDIAKVIEWYAQQRQTTLFQSEKKVFQ